MQIKIAERLRPYSHRPGTSFVLPGSGLSFQIFPTLIRVIDLRENLSKSPIEIKLDLSGPMKDFTIQQDLEQGFLRIWGNTPTGFMRYRIHAVENRFVIKIEKAPAGKMFFSSTEEGHLYSPPDTDRLSLGVTKQQDWVMMTRRQNLAEIFPLWHRLGQLVPQQFENGNTVQKTLLEKCRQALKESTPDTILEPFLNLFLAGFNEGLSPRLEDEDFQGFPLPVCAYPNPLLILSEGAQLIRSLFVQCQDEHILILPNLPSQFHCGRMKQVSCGKWGKLDLEWTKKQIRRLVLYAEKTGRLHLHFQKAKKYRLRHANNDRGRLIKVGDSLDIQKGQIYWFDNFEK